MRIIIETDQPDESQRPSRPAETQRGTMTLDGGPAPAALLRQFGRIPDTQAQTQEPDQATTSTQGETRPESEPAETEGRQEQPNPLRHGAAVAAQGHESGDNATGQADNQ